MTSESTSSGDVVTGTVRWSPQASLWWAAMTLAALIGGIATFTWQAFALFLAVTALVLLLGHSLGSHRKLIHNSFQCPKWLEYLLVYLGVQVGLAGPLGLVAQHDLRDYAQRQKDCHDFLRHGSSFWRDAWWQLHCKLILKSPPQLAISPAIAQDRFYQFLQKTWMLQQLPPAILLYFIGGWAFVFWGVCARISACVTGHWLIGFFAHNHGPMHNVLDDAAVQGHNVKLASLLTMGESWHNNHHAYPGSARLGLYAGEWDPGWWVLSIMGKCGLAWNFRLPQDCPHRPALRALDNAQMIVNASPVFGLRHTIRAIFVLSKKLLAQQKNIVLQGPCVRLSESRLQFFAGTGVTLGYAPSTPRLQLKEQDLTVFGLPALLIAFGSRNHWSAAIAVILLPLATLCELLRGSLTTMPPSMTA